MGSTGPNGPNLGEWSITQNINIVSLLAPSHNSSPTARTIFLGTQSKLRVLDAARQCSGYLL
jgi:hypothetical protein